jgi:hypothetical protein
MTPTDALAAAIHRKRAEQCHVDAARLSALGLTNSAKSALQMARVEDDIAYMLSTGREPRRVTS